MKTGVPNYRKRSLYWLVLGLGFVHGLIYVVIIPPWQHYDEPTHLERLYWTAQPLRASETNESALTLPLEVAASMCDFGFWQGNLCPGLPLAYTRAPTLAELYVDQQPLYYYLAAPIQVLCTSSVEHCLYAGRLFSVMLSLITALVAYQLVNDLLTDRWTAFAISALILLIPAYTNDMSAVNNDVAAVLVFSLLLWGSVRLLRDGPSLWRLIWVGGMGILAFLTKRTAAVGILVAGAVIASSFLPGKRWLWAAGGAIVLIILLVTLDLSGTAFWYSVGDVDASPVHADVVGPVGTRALCVDQGSYVVQELNRTQVIALRNHTVTLGGWIRSLSGPQTGSGIKLYIDDQLYAQNLTADKEWQFQAIPITVPESSSVIQVNLSADAGTVCYDGIVLVEGTFSSDAPQFGSFFSQRGVWDGKPIKNLVANGTAEQLWPQFVPWASQLVRRSGLTRGLSPNLYLYSILDWRRTGWIYSKVWKNLWETFWAHFGWSLSVGLGRAEWITSTITWLGLGGAAWLGLRNSLIHAPPVPWQRRAFIFLVLATALVWVVALVWYSHPMLENLSSVHIAVARYVYPVIIPTILFLYLGWRELLPSRLKSFLPLGAVLGMAVLDTICLSGILLPTYYLH